MDTVALPPARTGTASSKVSTAPLNGTSVIVSLGLFAIGAFTIIELLARFLFASEASWLGLLASIALGVLATAAFRDHMREAEPIAE